MCDYRPSHEYISVPPKLCFYINVHAQPVARSTTPMKAHSTFLPIGASPVGLEDAATEVELELGLPEVDAVLLSESLLGRTTPP